MPPHVATTSLLFDAESTSPFSLGKRHGLYLAPFSRFSQPDRASEYESFRLTLAAPRSNASPERSAEPTTEDGNDPIIYANGCARSFQEPTAVMLCRTVRPRRLLID